ncbi:hypothetical protein D3C75_987270 [compost metagenome]
MAAGRPCLPSPRTTLRHPGNWAPVPGWRWGHKAIWPAGSKTASGNWGCVLPMAAWSVSPAPTHVFAAWPWMPNTCTRLPPRRSARRRSSPSPAATTRSAYWPVAPKCCRQGISACRSRSTTTVTVIAPTASSTRQPGRKVPRRWCCSSMAARLRPVIPCSTHASSTGPNAASPSPT